MSRFLVDDKDIHEAYTAKLHNIVKERIETELGEKVEDMDDCLDFVYHCGHLINIEVI